MIYYIKGKDTLYNWFECFYCHHIFTYFEADHDRKDDYYMKCPYCGKSDGIESILLDEKEENKLLKKRHYGKSNH